MSGSQTIATSETRLEALKLQSSAYGVTLPVVYGVTRVPGNMLWYGGFVAIPKTSTSGAGGKGGGVKTQQTTYTYQAAVMMGLCEGEISGVARGWRGKTLFQGGLSASQIINAQQSYTVPSGGGSVTVANAATYSADAGVVSPTGGGPNQDRASTLAAGLDYTRVDGTYTFPGGVLDGLTLAISYQYTVPGVQQTSLQQMGLSFAKGGVGQAVWSYLSTTVPAQALGYSGVAYVYASAYDLSSTATVDNHNFEVQAQLAYSVSSSLPDADPAQIAFDLLTDARYGAGFPAAKVDTTAAWSAFCRAAGLLMSPALTEQAAAAEVLAKLARLTSTALVWSEGVLKCIPYGDAAISGNGATYTPNTTAVYDLTDDHFLDKDNPVRLVRKPQADAYNHVRVEYLDRGTWDAANSRWTGLYNTSVVDAKDQANIDTYGLRSAEVLQAHWICDGGVARAVAQLLLQRALYVRNTYEFKLPWNFALLEPMDLVTLTDSTLSLVQTPVRITEVSEAEDGELALVAEDFPLGVASTVLYPAQANAGYAHNYNVAPGSITSTVVFEAPVELTATGLEVYVAVNSTSATWGGCRVWLSMDGSNYRQLATINGGSRVGRITGPVAAGVLPVDVGSNQQLISGSAADAAALSTLCYVGGAAPEYLAYTTATLTGAGLYSLTLAARGAYSTPQSAHATSDPFVRVDGAVAKSGPLDLALIGKTVSFKFTSFNVFGGAEESLASVSAVPYTITGTMARLPPSAPTGVVALAEPFGIRISCAANPEPDVQRYEYRMGASWAAATVLEPNGGTSYLWQVQLLGSYTLWVAAVDALGNYSTPVSAAFTVAGGTVGAFASAISGGNLSLAWSATAGAFAIAGYEVRVGATWAAGTLAQFVQASRYTELVRWGGSRVYWVAAVDVRGNYGTPMSLAVSINAPGPVGSQRADVVDNNALLYWAAPTTGDLPVDRYEVRKGASWAAGTVVGSNGNSTFTAVFEQQAGAYVYWITAFDSAGNQGTPASVTATINQPPDYILRNNFDSSFAGTRANMYLEAGALIGPVVTSETWATHFSGRAWASPQDQINAGFPLYAQPSATSGSYEEVIDYGGALPATIVTATLNATVLAGTVTATPTISWSADNVTYTSGGSGQAKVLAAAGFRYVKVRYDFTCTAGANLIQVSGINVKLANKLKTDSGSGTITNAATGLVVAFNVPFLLADTPIVQPAGTVPLTPVVDFAGGANPTQFTVYLYTAAGAKTTGSFSWASRGY